MDRIGAGTGDGGFGAPATPAAPGAADAVALETVPGFRVTLHNFQGPFDLLLTLIGKHELDITDVSLSLVTDEFIAYLNAADDRTLDEASEFLVVAATLLDLKIASLLPQGEVVDAEDVALLEARDLLFARLLQYRAFKEASAWFRARLSDEERRHARTVRLDDRFRSREPELVWTLGPEDFRALAVLGLTPKQEPSVGLEHLHAPLVSIREQAAIIVAALRQRGSSTFRELIDDTVERGVIVARFLAILELYRRASVSFDQAAPLGELTVRWANTAWTDADLATLGADYD
ncbi:segregation and condensation protein A [Leucobacter sp. M11]|uniref:segregation and condensation protein A n=1 Tax=Leucobacter sp. M11 TaxID=2993565 RepID=UPI003FA5F1B2